MKPYLLKEKREVSKKLTAIWWDSVLIWKSNRSECCQKSQWL